jgi:glucokinase
VPCFLENDVRMATFGVMHHPQFAEVKNLAYLSVGTGIAAGLFLNGELYRGAHGMAGEIGHVVIDPAGPRCQCGGRGCLEALAAGPAIARRALEYVSQGVSTSLRQVNPLTADAVYREALKGDPAALEITREAGKYQARALQHLVMTYDVEVVVIGGGVARAGNAFFRPILDEIEQQRQVSALAFEMLQPTIFRLLPGRYEAALWGGVVLARLGIQRLQSNLPGMRIGKQDPKREEADSENISNQPSLHRINKPY